MFEITLDGEYSVLKIVLIFMADNIKFAIIIIHVHSYDK